MYVCMYVCFLCLFTLLYLFDPYYLLRLEVVASSSFQEVLAFQALGLALRIFALKVQGTCCFEFRHNSVQGLEFLSSEQGLGGLN